MFLDQIHRKRFVIFYFCCFTISYCWLFFNGLLLSQLKPVFFLNRLDLSLNLLFLTGIQHAVMNNNSLRLFFDVGYYALPLLLLIACIRNNRLQYLLAAVIVFFNLVYALLLSSLSMLSVEGFVGWILVPLIFIARSGKGFYYTMHCIRFLFLLVFFSAGLWKIRGGGIFNIEEMSAILLRQHAPYITELPNDWFTRCVYYLANHNKLSYAFYFIATVAELVFVLGFFTKRFDKLLIVAFILFVVFDFALMRINYFAWSAFLGCLWFSRYDEPLQWKEQRSAAQR